MQRYFINRENTNEESIEISGDDFHHMIRVMRMKVDNEFWAVFNNSKTALMRITQIFESNLIAKIVKWETEKKELPVFISIASGLPKGDKLEWIIQKGTELGASQFIPFLAERSIVKWEKKKAQRKIERWKKIAKEAAEQSHRQKIPNIVQPVSLEELIKISNEFHWKLLAYEEAAKEGESSNFAKILQSVKPDEKMLIVFGPEGGISEQEKQHLIDNGFELCGLGPRILRTETAPLYTLAAVSYHFELLMR